jgi:ADP-ribosylglycohydrolase
MIGALVGDIVGSIYERNNIKTTDFPLFQKRCRFTDDSVLTVALADAILTGTPYELKLREYFDRYPQAGYGRGFRAWAEGHNPEPYNSSGNGSGMRISPAGWAFDTLGDVLEKAKEFTAVTHNHPEGIKGGQAVAAAIFLGRTGCGKQEIRKYIEENFAYDLSMNCDLIRPDYKFDRTAQGTVPQAIIAFLDSSDFENAIRLAVSLGGDTDTLACITGSIAEAFYGGVPDYIQVQALDFLDGPLRQVTFRFIERFMGREINSSQSAQALPGHGGSDRDGFPG